MKTKGLILLGASIATFNPGNAQAGENKIVFSCSQRGEGAFKQLTIHEDSEGNHEYSARRCIGLWSACTYENSGEVDADLYQGHVNGAFKNEDVRAYFICGKQLVFVDRKNSVSFVFRSEECLLLD